MRNVYIYEFHNLFIFFMAVLIQLSLKSLSLELIFVACEGNFGASNGSIYTLKNNGDVEFIENVLRCCSVNRSVRK